MGTNTTIDAVRQQNQQATLSQKDIGLTELDGFQLPSAVTEEFLDRMQKEVNILGMADTMTLARLEQEVPQFGVPRLSGHARAEEASRTTNSAAESGEVKFNATDQSYYILVEPKRDALKNTHYGPDQFGDYIIDQFVQRWGNDIGLIGIRAGASAATSSPSAVRPNSTPRGTAGSPSQKEATRRRTASALRTRPTRKPARCRRSIWLARRSTRRCSTTQSRRSTRGSATPTVSSSSATPTRSRPTP
ncbi:hypothetical protein NGM07_20065 [Halorussus vallis]|uniref:hypothetical protein n=1 Tax=Halorussus vallis TaxID=2953749 RepID=UPI0020A21372|nr:hypothetical protein [Halorussus vallis]USZ75711.1 hypothetical protein NGM07_20065 [Halorussus vallis]